MNLNLMKLKRERKGKDPSMWPSSAHEKFPKPSPSIPSSMSLRESPVPEFGRQSTARIPMQRVIVSINGRLGLGMQPTQLPTHDTSRLRDAILFHCRHRLPTRPHNAQVRSTRVVPRKVRKNAGDAERTTPPEVVRLREPERFLKVLCAP